MENRKNLIWLLISLLIAGLTVYAILNSFKGYSLDKFLNYVSSANPLWIGFSILVMFGYVACEAFSLLYALKALGHKKKLSRGVVYASSEIYFSAITPSASGGQPVSGFFMHRDGIPMGVVAAALLLNLIMYFVAVLVLGIITMAAGFGIFVEFGTVSKVLILAGYVIISLMILFFYMTMYKESLLRGMGEWMVSLLKKLKLSRHPETLMDRLDKRIHEFRSGVEKLAGMKKMVTAVFFLNLFQRVAQICITQIVYMSTGGSFLNSLKVWAVQLFVVMGSNYIPIPGGMGAADYLLFDGLHSMMGISAALNLELLSRTISFYSCVIICGIISLAAFLSAKRNERG